MRSCSGSLRRAQPRLGTLVEIGAHGAIARLPAAIERAFGAIAEIERLMSYHDPASDVARLNRSAHAGPVEVHSHTWAVLAEAARIAAASDGAFDVSVAPALVRWGYLPGARARAPAAAPRGFEAIELLSGSRVRFAAPRWIDLGGIAKGYAVDVACEALERAGVSDYLVNAGGDLRVGARATAIHVRDPREPRRLVPLAELAGAALATSARYFGERAAPSGAMHPIVAPATHAPARYRGSISVCAERCTIADALTKVVAVLGARSEPVLRRFAAEARVLPDAARAAPEPAAPRLRRSA